MTQSQSRKDKRRLSPDAQQLILEQSVANRIKSDVDYANHFILRSFRLTITQESQPLISHKVEEHTGHYRNPKASLIMRMQRKKELTTTSQIISKMITKCRKYIYSPKTYYENNMLVRDHFEPFFCSLFPFQSAVSQRYGSVPANDNYQSR